MSPRTWLLLLAGCCAAVAHGEVLRGTVSHVTDGDTLWVKPAGGGRALEIRLLDLDAPEGCQPFGPDARQALTRRVLNQRVRVHTRGSDDYGRVLARIEHRRQDVGAWMVGQGYAWSTSYRGQPGGYAALQAQARAGRAGLWSAPGALHPRTFRKRFGRCQ